MLCPRGPAPGAKAHARWQRLAHHQHLPDGRRRDEPNQATGVIDDADGWHRLLLQQPKGLIERAAVADGRNVRSHRLSDAGVVSELLESADDLGAAEQADDAMVGVDHRELTL